MPRSLHVPRFVRLIGNIFGEAMIDDLMDWSAALAYYFLFSLFPLVLVCVAMVGTFQLTGLVDSIIAAVTRALPLSAAELVTRELTKLIQSRHAGLISLATILSLYSSSQGFSGLMTALNAAYEVPETRPYWKRMLLAIGLSFSAGVLMLIALVVLVFGHRMLLYLIGTFHVGPYTAILWGGVRWAIIFGFLLLAMMLLYRVAPNVKHRNVGFLPAAMTAVTLWAAASIGLGIYINHFSNYAATYGSLGAVIGLMLWFYVFAFSLLIGAEVHSEILKMRGIYTKPKWLERQAKAQSALKQAESEGISAATRKAA